MEGIDLFAKILAFVKVFFSMQKEGTRKEDEI